MRDLPCRGLVEVFLKRGFVQKALHTRAYPSVQTIITVCKSFESLEFNDVCAATDTIKIHLFSNVLDIDENYYSQNNLIGLIKRSQKGINYFICCSPYITDFKTNRIDNFFRSFKDREIIFSEDNRADEWTNNWTRVVRVFRASL